MKYVSQPISRSTLYFADVPFDIRGIFQQLTPPPSSSPRGKKYNIYDGRTIFCPEPFIVRDLTGLEIIYAVNLSSTKLSCSAA